MNREQLYQAIGDIDDAYIEEALSTRKGHSKPKVVIMFSALAASLLLVLSLSSILTIDNQLVFNEIQVLNSKEVPLDFSGYTSYSLTLEEANDYIAVLTIPKVIKGLPMLINDSILVKDNDILAYDRFEFTYAEQAGQRIVLSTATLEHSKKAIFRIGDASRSSIIENQDVKLGYEDQSIMPIERYYAEFEVDGVFVTLKTSGLSKEDFIDIIKGLLTDQ